MILIEDFRRNNTQPWPQPYDWAEEFKDSESLSLAVADIVLLIALRLGQSLSLWPDSPQ